jgi:bile acid:Na+ symporter, BASS family
MTVLIALKASLALMVLGAGLSSTPRDVTYLLRHRSLLLRSFVSMDVIMPLFAVWPH